jgi:hypothetical protein
MQMLDYAMSNAQPEDSPTFSLSVLPANSQTFLSTEECYELLGALLQGPVAEGNYDGNAHDSKKRRLTTSSEGSDTTSDQDTIFVSDMDACVVKCKKWINYPIVGIHPRRVLCRLWGAQKRQFLAFKVGRGYGAAGYSPHGTRGGAC